jgi:hypothetical protein
MKKYLCTLFLLPALLVAFASTTAKAEDVVVPDDDDPNAQITYVTLVWDRNPEPDIAGYNVYYGRISGDYTRLVTVTDPRARIGVRGSRTVYFAVTAYNTSGVESALSEEVHWP